MQRRFCAPYRSALTACAASSDINRRLENYALGYADRLAEQRR
jgi:hypothetical protein